ncbi:MAG: hypothetical protein V1729_00660 [Candidatus Woesearchaeota archaeon]
MKQKGISHAVAISFITLSLILLIITIYLADQNKELKSNIQDLTLLNEQQKADSARTIAEYLTEIQQKDSLIAGIDSEKRKLEGDLNDLNSSYEEIQIQHGTLSQDYQGLKIQVTGTLEKIDEYNEEIEESMDWFRYNSALGKSQKEGFARMYIDTDCYYPADNACYIKTGCLHLVNTENLDLRYRYDLETSKEIDKLQSLSEFISNKGGDCEDYSLFFKAEWNYLLDQCMKTHDPEKIIIEGWYQDEKSSDRHWLDYDKDWYIDDVTGIKLSKGYIYPNVVCGLVYNFRLAKPSGHCVIALTQKRMESLQDIELLDHAYLIEPQDGSYMGRVNEVPGLKLLVDGEREELIFTPHIFSVITDNDYFLFYNSAWHSYSQFEDQLIEHKRILSEI